MLNNKSIVLISAMAMAMPVMAMEINKEDARRELIENMEKEKGSIHKYLEEGEITEKTNEENNKRLNSFLKEFKENNADVSLVVIGPGKRSDQEIPRYIEKFNQSHLDKKVSIFSIEPLYYTNYKEKFYIPHPFLNQKFSVSKKEEDGSIWIGSENGLKFLAFSIYLPEENENTDFYNNFYEIIKSKLDKGKSVLIGNHMSAIVPYDIPDIVKIFNKQFDDNLKRKFVLYTQAGFLSTAGARQIDTSYYLSTGKFIVDPEKRKDEVILANKDTILHISNDLFNPLVNIQ